MKPLFFFVVIANVALFMWEYRSGAFAPVIETRSPDTDLGQEQILLVSELKNIPQPIIPAPVSEPPVEETALSEVLSPVSEGINKSTPNNPAAEETGAVSEVLPPASESIDKSAPKDPTAEETGAVSEVLPSSSESINKSAPDDLTAKEIAMNCFEVGPFISSKAYHAWSNRLKDIESDIKPVTRDQQIASSYIVYYPAAETAAQSEADIQILKNHGIKDPWLLTGEDSNNISLGVFRTEASALTMKSELLAKGINAEVEARYKIKVRKYALIRGDSKVTERLDAMKKTYPQLTVKQIPDTTQGCW